MSLFQLDPEAHAARTRSAPQPVHLPSLKESILRGALGFTVVSVLGFCPWAIFGAVFKDYKQAYGGHALEMYIACAVLFLVASAPVLHRLIIGPGSLFRFYGLFIPGFILYSAAWICCFSMIRGNLGGALGLLLGQALFAAVLCGAFNAWRVYVVITIMLFVGNALGYFGWGLVIVYVMNFKEPTWAMLMWGVTYGLGFGAGLGYAFFACQEKVRENLKGT